MCMSARTLQSGESISYLYILGVPVFSCTIYKYEKNKQDGYTEYSFEIYNIFSYFFYQTTISSQY
jgi:hypothetical protein